VQYAQTQLWGDAGFPAREYLRCERGLTDDTIRHFGLGYCPTALYDKPVARWGLAQGKSVYLSPGIVIPWEAGGTIWQVQIRRPSDADTLAAYMDRFVEFRPTAKYMAVRGSQGKALFGAADLRGNGQPLLLAEGEFDAMLAWQELSDLVDVATLGGASKANGGIPRHWMLRLLPYRVIYVAYDVDENGAGDKGAAALAKLSRRVRRVKVPHGGDIVGFWRQGGDLRAWVQAMLVLNGGTGNEALLAPSQSPGRPGTPARRRACM